MNNNKDYNKRDHSHCWTKENPPCGLKGDHMCCLCGESDLCNHMILTPSPDHNGGLTCAEKKPCKWHDKQTSHVSLHSKKDVSKEKKCDAGPHCKDPECTEHEIKEPWIEKFDKEFGKLTLGTLSGDIGSPVFHNNELEVPRLKSFISQEIEKACNEGMSDEVRNCPHGNKAYADGVRDTVKAMLEGWKGRLSFDCVYEDEIRAWAKEKGIEI